ncbi:VapE domain-containing protein [Vibrio breoganii]|uniref:Virulence protein n=1 Tax=Vibrio breoganii TaxID=553239 RepID=A0AAP8SYP7_9VIBR|nr:VapE domain-containing protein [Vibrio breoganii]PMK58694.1 virulence protein [Vibrio breoganii]PMK80301.1 virulence protein [Vibrio breoganii]PMO92871.1 virulence protein [Vibrio breoganii]PMP16762.1 virulence protein [Vibrio breoganii]
MDNQKSLLQFPDVSYTESGKVTVLNTANNLRALLGNAGYVARFNKMNLETEVFKDGCCLGAPELIRSELISLASVHSLPKSAIDDHFAAIALDDAYHPVAELLSGEWDGIYRVDRVIGCLKARDPELSSLIMRRWLIGCIASLIKPSFKSKLVPVLQGGQSYKKTAFVERLSCILEGAFLEGAELNPESKDSVLSVIRSWIAELGELERTTKYCQGSLKAFISKRCDTVRPPYNRTDIKKPRQTNLIATVNGLEFLKDETGNNRYGVIELIAPIDMDSLNEVLGWEFNSSGELTLVSPDSLIQFWLEVKHLLEFKQEGWVLSEEEQLLVSAEADRFVDKGPWYKTISDHVAECEGKAREWMTTKQICCFLKIDLGKVNVVGKALSLLAKEGKLQRKMLDGTNRYCFPTVVPF